MCVCRDVTDSGTAEITPGTDSSDINPLAHKHTHTYVFTSRALIQFTHCRTILSPVDSSFEHSTQFVMPAFCLISIVNLCFTSFGFLNGNF